MLEASKHTLFQEYAVLLYATYLMPDITFASIFWPYLMNGIRCVTPCNIPYDRYNVFYKLLTIPYDWNKMCFSI